MKTALCLSGQPRGLKKSFESIQKNVIEINGCDVFVHCWTDESIRGKQFRPDTPFDIFEIDTEDFIIKNYKPKLFTFETQFQFTKIYRDSLNFPCYNQKTNPRPWFNIQSMFYSIHQSDLLRQSYELRKDFTYDCVIRCRFDYTFFEKFDLNFQDMNFLHTKSDCKHTNYAINDHIAYGNSKIMSSYSSAFTKLKEYYEKGIEFNSEVLLGYHAMVSGLLIDKNINNNSCQITTTDQRKKFR